MPNIVTQKSNFPIQPGNIPVPSQHMQLINSFSDLEHACESQVAAAWLLFYAQVKKQWLPFTGEELTAFIHQHKDRSSGFFDMSVLVARGLIVLDNNHYHYTDTFIEKCAR